MVKTDFLFNIFPGFCRGLAPAQKGIWGKMNALQMIEHVTESAEIASGLIPKNLLTPPEHLQKFRDFMLSEKPFRENTVNAEMPEEPEAPRSTSISESVNKLEDALKIFRENFSGSEEMIVMNPFFGPLNYAQWIHLLHKHALHHARQFGYQEAV